MIAKMEQTRLRLKYLREVKKYSYREIAKEIGISKTSIYNFVNGETVILSAYLKIDEYVRHEMKHISRNNKYNKAITFSEWLSNQK